MTALNLGAMICIVALTMTQVHDGNAKPREMTSPNSLAIASSRALTISIKVDFNENGFFVTSVGPDHYAFSKKHASWMASQKGCRDINSELMVLNTPAKKSRVIEYLKEKGFVDVPYWVYTFVDDSGKVIMHACTEVKMNSNFKLEVTPENLAPCTKLNFYICYS